MAAQWNQLAYGPIEQSMLIGKAGEPPASPAADVADFLFVVPHDMELYALAASMATAPTANTTLQLRRSVDNGASFSNVFGTVTVANGARVGSSTPTAVNVSAGDILNFSITAGGGSGANIALFIRSRRY